MGAFPRGCQRPDHVPPRMGTKAKIHDKVALESRLMGEIHRIMSTMSLVTISCANKKLRTELEAKWKHTS
jgi:hypothetical protein